MIRDPQQITELIERAAVKAQREASGEVKPAFTGKVKWPVESTVGPGLEGAIACESSVGYVNGSQGVLIYRGYNVFDLCAHSTFEEVAYLLTHGRLPTTTQLTNYRTQLGEQRSVTKTLRTLMSFPVEEMHPMAALRLGTNLMRQEFTTVDKEASRPDARRAIGTDEDSIAMETMPHGEPQAIYEFDRTRDTKKKAEPRYVEEASSGQHAALHLIASVATLAAAISRLRQGLMPIGPDSKLSLAADLLRMFSGRHPTPVEERIMDVSLILHADHGMNASTFASLVVASTMSDMYASIGAGIASLAGPLHGGANEQVVRQLEAIGSPENVAGWYEKQVAKKAKITGFGHRVYKTYDPRARILGPLAKSLVKANKDTRQLYDTAVALEKCVVSTLGKEKGIYPNVDFYSGLVYRALDIPIDMFTPIFAVSRVAGWTARVLEYLEHNRLFRPRAIYTGSLDREYVAIDKRRSRKK